MSTCLRRWSKADYDEIEIFLEDSTGVEDAQSMMNQIETFDGVEKVEYRTKEDALNIMKKRWGESSYLLDSLGENPLPNSILITVSSLESAGKVTQQVSGFEGIEDIKYYRETVEKLTKVTDFLQIAALVIMAFLIVVSVVVVANTIKLTVFARAREISIMKYVGADQLVYPGTVSGGGDHHRHLRFAGFGRHYLFAVQQDRRSLQRAGADDPFYSAGSCRLSFC